MIYKAIYRQWRPKTFSDILGQEAVITTLKNQIISDQIAHAYLFSGIRGTGKTSTARVFARALNCLDLSNGEPCNQCEFCLGNLKETVMDVVEIDAASNNGVDDIRELRETIKYPPAQMKYKIYIIDEVHMLSQGAFNALLKTLEEPPEYAVFILATTESQKIPATILSRCQRYNFKRFSNDMIITHLNDICKSVNIQSEKRALEVIAKNSEGALRDAQSLLEQCIAGVEGHLTYKHVISILGLASEEFFNQFAEYIFGGDISNVMQSIDQYLSDGGRVDGLIDKLIEYYRKLMFIKAKVDLDSFCTDSTEQIQILETQSNRLSIDDIIINIDMLGKLSAQLKWISQPRIHLEMSIIKLMQRISSKYVSNLSNNALETPDVDLHKECNFNVKDDKIRDEKISEDNIDNDIVPTSTISFEMINKNWNDILSEIRNERIQTHAFLIEGKLHKLEGNKLLVLFPGKSYSFHMDMLMKPENMEIIQKVLNRRFDMKIVIECICNGEDKNAENFKKKENSYSNRDKIRKYLGDYENKLI